MKRIVLTMMALWILCGVVLAAESEETETPIVLGGIPLCGDPDIARDYLASLVPAKNQDMFLDQWRNHRSNGPSGTIEIKISDPVVPLKIGEKERNPSTLYVFLLDDRIHAVEARWAPRSGWGNFNELATELETKVRGALGAPDSVISSSPARGLFGSSGKSEKEVVWQRENRVVRVFTRIGQWKNYVAVDATCTPTLEDTAGENVF